MIVRSESTFFDWYPLAMLGTPNLHAAYQNVEVDLIAVHNEGRCYYPGPHSFPDSASSCLPSGCFLVLSLPALLSSVGRSALGLRRSLEACRWLGKVPLSSSRWAFAQSLWMLCCVGRDLRGDVDRMIDFESR